MDQFTYIRAGSINKDIILHTHNYLKGYVFSSANALSANLFIIKDTKQLREFYIIFHF